MLNRVAILPLFVLSLAAALAACHGSSGVTPTPAPSTSFTPDPNIKHATVEVTILGTPAPKISVAISTPHPYPSGRPGKAFSTKITNKKGIVIFYDLKPDGTYCWVATLAPGQQSSTCQSWVDWQTTTVMLGT
jgi:hypothetical protein